MKLSRMAVFAVCIVALILALEFPAGSQTFDKLTYFTFSAPAEIPGGKVLPAGKYAFKVLDLEGARNIVQIFNADQTQLIATVLTIPDYRQNPTDKAVIKFSETAQGGPPAIKEWFYPGDNYGQEFVYPKNRAVELAKVANQPVPSMSTNMASNITPAPDTNKASDASIQAMKNAPLKAEEPEGQEVEVAEAFIVQPAVAAPDSSDTKVAEQLPKTASLFPVFGLVGCSFIIAGGLLWLISKRTA
ncbi:MAG TPA: hypothetical protein VHX49_15400 [Candidatus Acidoferrales bacterium]|jgi:hypothetical protein|nr:hypothetical protein [Candidatus Acidoferrales bacterium]